MSLLEVPGIKDDYSHYRTVYFLQEKSDTIHKLKHFIKFCKTFTGNSVKTIRTDNGIEFVNRERAKLFEGEGIIHEKSVSYTSEQNGKIERDMRTVAEAARSMLHAKKLDDHLWAEAVNTTVYVLNRTSKKVDEKTPYQIWTRKDFDVNTLRVFGNEVSVHIPKVKKKKWDSKTVIFVGYGETTKGYRVNLPDIQSVEIKRDVEFLKLGDNTTAQKIQEATEIAEIGEEDNSDWDPGEVADYIHNETDDHQDE